MQLYFRPIIAGPIFMAIAAVTATQAVADTSVHSLAGARSALKTSDARKAFDREMSGAPEPNGFGVTLPTGFSKAMLTAQIAPGIDPARLILAGVKPWPQQPDAYVAVLCFAPTAAAAKPTPGAAPLLRCDTYDDTTPDLWLGVYTRGADGVAHLIARTNNAVTTQTDWSTSNIEAPQSIESDDGSAAAKALPQSWDRFDFAKYQLRNGEMAFGVRAGWSEGYAGGGAAFEALYLFRIEGKTLHAVFAQPMMFSKMLAGDWHKDGTRDHEMSDGSNTLAVLPGVTAGFHDLQLREQRGKWRQTFQWSDETHSYVPKD